ncbi:hypothetical protein P5G61_22090 [Paenibacillus sp. F6_3S_P_1C]|uniref:Uncharacterized protein n=1 Tax=Paenibacillus vandeheii TaxID=3035917 RepID=A0ABT8JFU0_9BACL|nr:hypothetical protein [Paenibacillus vandeheii]KGP81391.1 hypothetical protein P363_0128290 [Paenibacillus sp. MAEPY1]KGP82027.1 hypothetical protein P364_0114545 [Paenibacillus sp. MAEPY2]MDN4603949.1 hypothetical protein [Paenibacillus vandeheii]
MSNTDELIKIEISEFIKQKQYFFPLPTGKITEEHWNWCNLVYGLITRIERYWNIEDFYNQFKSTIYSLADKTGDRMLMHRLNILFDENRKNRY